MRTETPPSRVKWVHEAWVAKARCSLSLSLSLTLTLTLTLTLFPTLTLALTLTLTLSKARCSLTLGDAGTAVADARAATAMCCRTPSGWLALAEALEANGEAPGAKEARAELAYLAGS